jgi:hypothetical protein
MPNANPEPGPLLVGWPGADWRVIQPMLDAGQMPHLRSLVDTGVIGNLMSLVPAVAPMLATTVATGLRADRHGILGFAAPTDTGPGLRPVLSTDLRTPPLWQQLAAAGRPAAAVGWPVTHPAGVFDALVVSDAFADARGARFDDWPVLEGSVSDPTLVETLAELRLHPSEVTAEQLTPFVPEGARIDQETDPRLLLLITAPARTATFHGVGTWIAERRDWDLLAIQIDLIERLSAAFMQYRAPRMPHVTETDFAIYRHCVDGAYRFMDLMLGRYLELIGPDTHVMVVSDHGFLTGDLRRPPAPRSRSERVSRGYREQGALVRCPGGAGPRHPARRTGVRRHPAGCGPDRPGAPRSAPGPRARRAGAGAGLRAGAAPRGQEGPPPLGTLEQDPAMAMAQSPALDADWAAGRILELAALARQERHAEAVEHLMRSIGLLYHQPNAHYNLGLSLAALGRPLQAIQAFENALAIQPDLSEAGTALKRTRVVLARKLAEQATRQEEEAPMRLALEPIGAVHDLIHDTRWSGPELAAEARRRAAVLHRFRGDGEDLFVIAHANSPSFFADLLAVWEAGGCAVCVNAGITATETANWIGGASAADHAPEDGLLGGAWGGQVAVRGDDGLPRARGEGEILVQTPSLMNGYYRRADLTAEVLQAGWYHTGDTGRIGDGGLLYLTGRNKYMINRAGIKVYPEELDLLLERHPDVLEACAFAAADAVSGESVAAAVRLRDGADTDAAALQAWVRARIRPEAVPGRMFPMAEIRRTDRGKLNRDNVARFCLGDDP